VASIYGLIDDNGNLRYIGKANDPVGRLKGHMRATRRRRTPLYDWLRGKPAPEMIVLESGCHDWEVSEREWIAAARTANVPLLNVADGGDQPSCPNDVCAANGRKNGAAVAADPRRKAIRDAKAAAVRTLRAFEREGRIAAVARLRTMIQRRALERPDLFGDWAHV
jgi:hypothetical protein